MHKKISTSEGCTGQQIWITFMQRSYEFFNE